MDYHVLNLPSIFTFTLFIFLILEIRKRISANRSISLPPGPMKLPLVGNLHNLVGSLPHRALSQLAKKHGPLMHLQLGELSLVVASSPETAKLVMKTHDAIFAQRPRVPNAHVLTYGSKDIVFSSGVYWRQLRKICTTELLSLQRVKSFRPIREGEVAKLVDSISSAPAGSPVNLSRKVSALTYRITARAAFGRKLSDTKSCAQQDEFIANAEESVAAAGGFGPADVFPSVKLLHVMSGTRSKVDKLFRTSDRILEAIIEEHKVNREGGVDRTEDLVDVLLNLHERRDLEIPLTIESIKAVILDIFTAGSETSSLVVEWAMSEMLKNPRIMRKAQSEVRRVFAAQRRVDEEGLDQLTFLKLIIKETLRLHPSAPLLGPRECQEQCTIDGYVVPSKTKVIVNAWAIGRDPRHWREPERFYPERFLDRAVDFRGNDFEFVPFGAGRRICPGIAFALPNVELPLASLLYHFDWEMAGGGRAEELDMAETFGATVGRLHDLCLIPIAYDPR